MNIIEAVQALSAGRGEGLRRQAWQRGAFLEISESESEPLIFNCGTTYISYACDFLADDYELVNPKPQTETVEVVGSTCIPSVIGSQRPMPALQAGVIST